jgi:3-isopropylmalate/(R)-2-methylmalate dehydratase small subunit
MLPFIRHSGKAVLLRRDHVDTDQIVPKQFLKRIERSGFGPCLFHSWRFAADGAPDPGFELNRPAAAGASILVAGANFGCGSSREHAAWALTDYGFRAVIAGSVAEIFQSNACQNGLLVATLQPHDLAELFRRLEAAGGAAELSLDLEQERVSDGSGFDARLLIAPHWRAMLMKGLDPIGQTLEAEPSIEAFERRRISFMRVAT